MTKHFFVFAMGFTVTFGQTPSGSGTRMTPPTIRDVSPRGIARGTSVELTVEGFNLSKASKIFFNQPGVTGKILRVKELPDLPDVRLGSNGTASTVDLGVSRTTNSSAENEGTGHSRRTAHKNSPPGSAQ